MLAHALQPPPTKSPKPLGSVHYLWLEWGWTRKRGGGGGQTFCDWFSWGVVGGVGYLFFSIFWAGAIFFNVLFLQKKKKKIPRKLQWTRIITVMGAQQ